MVNSAKTPTGKTPKGLVSIRIDSKAVKACFPRTHFTSEKNQVRKGIGISPASFNPDDKRIQLLQQTLQVEMESGKLDDGNGYFNEIRYQQILKQLGFISDLKKGKAVRTSDDQLPPKPELSLLEVWDNYLQYIEPKLKETTFAISYASTYTNFIKSAIEATKSEDAIKIRNWLIQNRNIRHTKFVLAKLSDAYKLAIRTKLIAHNPYEGMAEEITVKGAKGKTKDEVETDTDNDVLNKSKAYTWDEVQIILDYIQNTPSKQHWYSFIKFKFLTGCRTGEAIAFMWCDVLWNKEQILIRRNYNHETKKFYNLKNAIGENEIIRIFPMPKNGELWNLLKSIPQGELNDVVFKSKNLKTINDAAVRKIWRGGKDGTKGIITELIKQGKLDKYLPCYNTRHTFVTHQVHDLGRDEKIVSAWCGHGEMVSQKHYQDIADRALQINPELPANQQQLSSQQISSEQSRIEMLETQNKELLEMIKKLQEQLEQMKN